MIFTVNKFVVLSSLALLAVAYPGGSPPPKPSTTITVTSTPPAATTISQCNTGDAKCCNTVGTASSPAVATLLGLLGVVVEGIDAVIGLGCTPITVIGVGGGAKCTQQPVCCTGVEQHGLINVGCTPISL